MRYSSKNSTRQGWTIGLPNHKSRKYQGSGIRDSAEPPMPDIWFISIHPPASLPPNPLCSLVCTLHPLLIRQTPNSNPIYAERTPAALPQATWFAQKWGIWIRMLEFLYLFYYQQEDRVQKLFWFDMMAFIRTTICQDTFNSSTKTWPIVRSDFCWWPARRPPRHQPDPHPRDSRRSSGHWVHWPFPWYQSNNIAI